MFVVTSSTFQLWRIFMEFCINFLNLKAKCLNLFNTLGHLWKYMQIKPLHFISSNIYFLPSWHHVKNAIRWAHTATVSTFCGETGYNTYYFVKIHQFGFLARSFNGTVSFTLLIINTIAIETHVPNSNKKYVDDKKKTKLLSGKFYLQLIMSDPFVDDKNNV